MTASHFPEKITPFLKAKLDELAARHGYESNSYQGLALQYLRSDQEGELSSELNAKHYEASVAHNSTEGALPGLERLYRKTLVIEPTLVCLAHCRYCLRSNYGRHTLSEKQLIEVAHYCGSHPQAADLNEVLITGGDPLVIPQRLEVLLNALIEHAPNIRIVRIATRIPGQDPARIDENVAALFKNKPMIRFELATQINHPEEFCPEVEEAFRKLTDLGVTIYAQNVILRGVNDNVDVLVELYNRMRLNNIEAHYLFHCIPLKGIAHLRTTLDHGLELVRGLACSGKISGRAKPMLAVMTDIGKITLYDGVIRERRDGRILLQSNYSLRERQAWNRAWQLPTSAEVDENGLLRVWYVDGAPPASPGGRRTFNGRTHE